MSEEYVRKDVHDAQVETLTVAISDTRERIDDVKETVSRQISFWGVLMAVVAFLFAGMQLGLAVVLYFLTK